MSYDDLPDTINNAEEFLAVIGCVELRGNHVNWRTRIDGKGSFSQGTLCLRATFWRDDTDTGIPGRGHGRWWYLNLGCTKDAVVKTVWLAVKQVAEHELMEGFRIDGKRVFNPHASVADLLELG